MVFRRVHFSLSHWCFITLLRPGRARSGGKKGLLARSAIVGYTHFMIITADSRRRVTLPRPAHPGDAFDLEKTGRGQFLLTRLEKPSRIIRLSRKNGFLVATSGRRITMAVTRELINQFP